MNLDTIISKTTREVPYSKELVDSTVKSYIDYLSESLTAVRPTTVPYLGTFIVDKTKFFRVLLRKFVILRKLKDKMKILEKTKGEQNRTYITSLKKYNEVSVEFQKLWKYKQSQGWQFTYSMSKSKRSKGYFQKSYKQKEERDKLFA